MSLKSTVSSPSRQCKPVRPSVTTSCVVTTLISSLLPPLYAKGFTCEKFVHRTLTMQLFSMLKSDRSGPQGFSTMDSTLFQNDQSHMNGNCNAHFGQQVTWSNKTHSARSYIHHECPSDETTLPAKIIFFLLQFTGNNVKSFAVNVFVKSTIDCYRDSDYRHVIWNRRNLFFYFFFSGKGPCCGDMCSTFS